MLGKRDSLSSQVVRELTGKIQTAAYGAGQKIPTESELCAEYGVSRTVIREAVASLRSEGLLVSRQGIGVFVSAQPKLPPFQLESSAASTLADILQILELRISVEVEASSLAAERHTAIQLKKIRNRLKEMDSEFNEASGDSSHADFNFHVAIAQATNNPYFEKFTNFIGPFIIPRLRFSGLSNERSADLEYHAVIQSEHAEIVRCIAAREIEPARRAMRKHLLGSLERYRSLRSRT